MLSLGCGARAPEPVEPRPARGGTTLVAAAGPPCPPTTPLSPDELVDVPAGAVRSGCPRDRHASCLGQQVPAFSIQAAPTRSTSWVSWDAAQQSCVCRGARLPSEAEWERAREEGRITPEEADPTEWLLGWYTYFGPGAQHRLVGPGQAGIGNSRLVIKIFGGRSYRYGGPFEGTASGAPIAYRCVQGPPPVVPEVLCRWTGTAVDCGRDW